MLTGISDALTKLLLPYANDKEAKSLWTTRISSVISALRSSESSAVCIALNMLSPCLFGTDQHQALQILALITAFNCDISLAGELSFINRYLSQRQKCLVVDIYAGTVTGNISVRLITLQAHKRRLTAVLTSMSRQLVFSCGGRQDGLIKLTTPASSRRSPLQTPVVQGEAAETMSGAHPSLTLDVDIDAILGPLTLSDAASAIIGPLMVDLNISHSRSVLSKTTNVQVGKEIINIADLFACKLGTIDSPVGVVSIYYICPGISPESNTYLLFNHIKAAVVQMADILPRSLRPGSVSESTLQFEVRVDEMRQFFAFLAEFSLTKINHRSDFIFLETFGNKNKTAATDLGELRLYETLARVVDLNHFPHAQLDLAVSVYAPGPSAVFMVPESFRSLTATSSYRPFFNNCLININEKMSRLKDGQLHLRSAAVEKINFYSTLEDLVGQCSRPVLPPCALALLKGAVHGYSLAVGRAAPDREIGKLASVVVALAESKHQHWPYRFEVRIRPILIPDCLAMLTEFIRSSSILCFDSAKLVNRLHENAAALVGMIDTRPTAVTPETIFRSLVYEILFVRCFCSGSYNMSVLPPAYTRAAKELMSASPECPVLAVPVESIETLIASEDITGILTKLVRYDTALSAANMNVLVNLLGLRKLDLHQAAGLILDQYVADMCSKFRLQNDPCPLLTTAHTPEYVESHVGVTAPIDQIISATFITPGQKWLAIPFRAFMAEYVSSRQVPIRDLAAAIKACYITRGYSLAFNISLSDSRLRLAEKFKFIPVKNTTGLDFSPDAEDSQFITEKKAGLISRFINAAPYTRPSTKHIWSRAECIRILAGRSYYLSKFESAKGVWTYLAESSLFGFIFTRDYKNLKFKYSNLIKNTEELQRLELSVTTWTPESFSIDDRISELERFGYTLSSDAISIYREIFALETGLYGESLTLPPRQQPIPSEVSPAHVSPPDITPTANSGETFNSIVLARLDSIDQELKLLSERQNQMMQILSRLSCNSLQQQLPDIGLDDGAQVDASDGVVESSLMMADSIIESSQVSGATSPSGIYRRLLACYGTSSFTSRASGRRLYSNKNRPSATDWCTTLEQLGAEGYLSHVSGGVWVCNKMPTPTSPLNYSEAWPKLVAKYNGKSFTAKSVYFALFKRTENATVETCTVWLDSLVDDGRLALLEITGKIKKYVIAE